MPNLQELGNNFITKVRTATDEQLFQLYKEILSQCLGNCGIPEIDNIPSELVPPLSQDFLHIIDYLDRYPPMTIEELKASIGYVESEDSTAPAINSKESRLYELLKWQSKRHLLARGAMQEMAEHYFKCAPSTLRERIRRGAQ